MLRKPLPFFEAVLSGPGLVPEKIPIHVVSTVLSAVHRLASGGRAASVEEVEDEGVEEEDLEQDSSVTLLDVKRGSAVFRFTGRHPEEPLNRLRLLGTVLENPDELGDNSYILRPLEELSATARSLKCSITLRKPGDKEGVIAEIGPASFETIANSVFVHGDTEITGKVERVGGVTSLKCGLRVSFQPKRMLICRVKDADTARRLGEKLYQEVVVHGRATWFKSSWRIFAFKIENVHQLKPGTLEEAMEAIRDAGANNWDDIEDPQGFLEGAAKKK